MKKIYLGMLGLHTLYSYVILFQEIGVTDLVFLSHSYVTPLSCELGLFCKFFHRGGSLTFWGGLLSLTLFMKICMDMSKKLNPTIFPI